MNAGDGLTADDIFDGSSLLSRPYPTAARALRQVASGGSVESLSELDRTDAACARDFAIAVQGELAFDHRLDSWRYFDAPVWRLDQVKRALFRLQEHQEQRAVETISNAIKKHDQQALKFALRQLDARRLANVLELAGAQPDIRLQGDEFDRHPEELAHLGGVVELAESSHSYSRQGRPTDYHSLQCGVAFDPSEKRPRFEEFLVESLGDIEIVAFVKRWVGYVLTGFTNEQVFLCWLGAGANGKGVLADTLAYVLGSYAITLPFASFTQGAANGAAATPDLARLPGRRLGIASETRVTSRFDEAKLKSLTGEDTIAARQLYGQLFEFRPALKLLFLFNDRPKVSDLSYAFWRRALLVPFPRQFSEADRDPNLRAKLRAEGSGILNWAIEGYSEWRLVGLNPPPPIRSAVDEWRVESDVIAEFIGFGCEPAPGVWIHAGELFAAFKGWCDLEHVDERDRPGRKAFTARLGTMAEKRARNTGNGFVGLRPRGRVMK